MDKEGERGGGEIVGVAGTREKFETSVRNYSVRTAFKYPSSDREISEVAGRAQEDEGCRGKTSGRRAKKREGHEVQRRQKKEEQEEKEEKEEGRIGYNSASGSPKLVSRSGNVSSHPRPRYLFCTMTIRVGG